MEVAPCYTMLTLYTLYVYCSNCFTLPGTIRTLLVNFAEKVVFSQSTVLETEQVNNAINFLLKNLQIVQEKFVPNFATNNNEIIYTLFKPQTKMMKQEIGAQEIIMVSVHHHHDCIECLSSESKHCPRAALQSPYTTRYACRKIQMRRE